MRTADINKIVEVGCLRVELRPELNIVEFKVAKSSASDGSDSHIMGEKARMDLAGQVQNLQLALEQKEN